MLLEHVRNRLAAEAKFIQPCLPSPAPRPPTGPNWIHKIKHDGYRMMARRDGAGIRLLTRNGHDWSARFPLIVEAVNHLKIKSCLIDGEAVCCDEDGLASFQILRHRRQKHHAFFMPSIYWSSTARTCAESRSRCARRRWQGSLRKSRHGVRLNEHMEHPEGEVVFRHACELGL